MEHAGKWQATRRFAALDRIITFGLNGTVDVMEDGGTCSICTCCRSQGHFRGAARPAPRGHFSDIPHNIRQYIDIGEREANRLTILANKKTNILFCVN
jgi:hypothetical protein